MRIAINLPADYPPGWKIAAGALEFAREAPELVILLPEARMSHAEDQDPGTWDGAIVADYQPDLGVPQVSISPIPPDDILSVSIDQEKVVKLAVDKFLLIGLGSFAFFAPSWEISKLRWQAYKEQLGEQGFEAEWLRYENIGERLNAIRKPCAVLAVNDNEALIFLRICKSLGLRVPGDIHLIGVDDSPACMESEPSLSSIAMPFTLLGFHAARLCARMISGAAVASIKLPPSSLALRDSVKAESDDIKTAAEIAHFLRTHLSYPIQMEDVLRHSPVSRRKLEDVFRSAYKTSPIAYLKQLRLDHAKKLLRTTDDKLKDIAPKCGYRDANHLCRTFRECEGTSPINYRQSESNK